jgi:hypothetical protein
LTGFNRFRYTRPYWFNLPYSIGDKRTHGQTASGDLVAVQWFVNTSTLEYVSVYATSAYLNGTTTVSVPNLSPLTGFFPAAASGSTVDWAACVWWHLPLVRAADIEQRHRGGGDQRTVHFALRQAELLEPQQDPAILPADFGRSSV